MSFPQMFSLSLVSRPASCHPSHPFSGERQGEGAKMPEVLKPASSVVASGSSRAALLILPLLALVAPQASGQDSPVALRTGDVLNLTVVQQPDLSKKYPIESNGSVTIPLVGRLEAAGKTVDAFASELKNRLAAYLRNPQVVVDVERSKRVFVFGGVASPGMYQLTEHMTLIELLARAGYGGVSEAIIVRNTDAPAPAFPDNGDASTEVIRVNLREFERELERGNLSRNVALEDGDTIYVPRFDPNRVYVSGEVRSPGAYSVPEGTTVLQALALAGGPTERAALGRLRIIRIVDGEQKAVGGEVDDVVQPGDTILVPGRRF